MKWWCFTFWMYEIIHRCGGPEDGLPYMRRLTLFKCPLFCIFLHRFLLAEDECLHDHPWPFVSLILRGGYFEETHDPLPNCVNRARGRYCWDCLSRTKRRWYGPLSVLLRRASHAHRVVPAANKPMPVTLVVCGPRVRHWGFFTRIGWIGWKGYSHKAHCA